MPEKTHLTDRERLFALYRNRWLKREKAIHKIPEYLQICQQKREAFLQASKCYVDVMEKAIDGKILTQEEVEYLQKPVSLQKALSQLIFECWEKLESSPVEQDPEKLGGYKHTFDNATSFVAAFFKKVYYGASGDDATVKKLLDIELSRIKLSGTMQQYIDAATPPHSSGDWFDRLYVEMQKRKSQDKSI